MSTRGYVLKIGMEDQEDVNKKLSGYNIDMSNLSMAEKRDLLTAMEQSMTSAEEEEVQRCSQFEPEISEDEDESVPKQDFEQQCRILRCKGTTLLKASNDDECVVIKEVPNAPRYHGLGTPARAASSVGRPTQTSQRKPNGPAHSPHSAHRVEHPTSARKILQDMRESSAPRLLLQKRLFEAPCNTSPFDSQVIFNHTSNVDGIDVLTCSNDVPVEFECEKRRKVRNEVPFHFRPAGMSLDEYIIRFKTHSEILKKRMIEKQRNIMTFKPWGPPIQVSNMSMPTFQKEINDAFPIEGMTSDNSADPANISQERYNLRERKELPKRKNELFMYETDDSPDDDDEDVIPKKLKLQGNYSAFENSILRKTVSLSINPPKESSRGRDMVKNADAKRSRQNSSSSQKQTDIIENTSSDESDFCTGKDLVEPKRTLPLSNPVPPPKRKYKKKETGTKKKNVRAPSAKSGTWTRAKDRPKDDDGNDDPSPLTLRKLELEGRNKAVFEKKIGLTLQVSEEDTFKMLHEEPRDGDDILVECPICKKTFNQAQIERHADQCCEGPASLDDCDQSSSQGHKEMISCPICFNACPAGAEYERHMKQCNMAIGQ